MIDGKRHNVSIYKNKFKSEDKPSNEADFVAFKNFSKYEVEKYKNKNYTKKDL
tara:strand:+ start:465 stop:623 length:159 start_codon:yes stop_codon:yes gene_type:complete